MAGRPKLKDIAQAAGVSEMTVSRALRPGGDVSAKTRARISDIAARLGYVPDRIAGALASSRVNLVGVVVPSLENQVFPQVLAGISAGLDGSGLQPFIGASGYDAARETDLVREMMSWRPAGLIVTGLDHSDATRTLLSRAPCPVVEVMDIDGPAIDRAVGISHDQAGRRMARRIVEAGHRKIAYVGTGAQADRRAAKRLAGFTAGLADAGLTLIDSALHDGGSSVIAGRKMTAALLDRAPGLECIYYSSDVLSLGGLMHCIGAGLDVPGDLALAGFNNLELLAGMPVDLATTDSHRFDIGKTAASMIVAPDGGGEKVVEFSADVLPGASL